VLRIFLEVVLPIFLVAGAGSLLQRWRKLTVGPLNPLTVYVLSPALVFRLLMNAELPAATSGKIIAASVLTTVAIVVVSLGVSAVYRHARQMQSAFMLTNLFPNSGNMGLPIALLALGEIGLAFTTVIFVTQSVVGWTVGSFVAARSSGGGFGPMLQALRLPILYVLGLAIVLRGFAVSIPSPVNTAVGMLADAALPAMVLVLGFQINKGVDLSQLRDLVTSVAVRLVGSAFVAYGVTLLLGLDGAAQQAVILNAAMPAAVFTTILATEFNASPSFVGSAVVTSTLASLVTLTGIIYALQHWV